VSMVREIGHPMTSEDLVDFFKRYGVKKKRTDSL